MAKRLVRIKNVDKITKDLNKIFNNVRREKRLLNDIGKFVRDRIVFEARRGNTMASNVKTERLPKLKDSTKGIRKGIQEKRPGVVDPTFFDPDRSNVTLTGQLLRAFEYLIKGDRVVFLFKDRRSKLNPDDTSSNNEVYDDLRKRGFGFVGLDEKGQKRVKRLVLDEFRRTIKKIFK